MVSVMAIWSDLGSFLKGAGNKKYKLVHTWRFPNKEAHAGQFFSTKVLPNGNVQKRIATRYGNPGVIGIETQVVSPSGELLRSYAGVRAPEGTIIYGNNNSGLSKALHKLYDNQGNCYRF